MLSIEEIKQFIATPRSTSWYYKHYTELRNAIFSTMLHGVRYDLELAKAKAIELDQRKLVIKSELLELTGGIKLWSETTHRSLELISLLEAQRTAKEHYNSIPKEDKPARKAAKPGLLLIAGFIKQCRSSGQGSIIEVGTGLSDDKICGYLYRSLSIPTHSKRRKESGKTTETADDITLKKIRLKFPQHTKLIQLILEHRKCNKLMGYLDPSKVDNDGRIRCQYKTTGTQSGRLASSANPMGTGDNLQNYDRSLKTLLLPDKD